MLQSEPGAGAQGRLREPAHVRLERARRHRRRLGGDEHVAPPEVEVAVDAHGHRLPGGRRVERAAERLDRGHARAHARGKRHHLGARPQLTAGDTAGVGAAVSGGVAQDPLHREAQLARHAGGQLQRLEVLEQRRAGVPAQPLRALDHVVAVQRAHRQRPDGAEPDPRREQVEVGHDAVEDLLRPVDEIHLVDREDDVTHAEQGGDRGVAARLLDHALARVNQDDRHLGRRGARDHVARVLLVPGRVGEDEAPARGGEVAVRDIDRDALLALGAQAVGQQRQVEVPVAVARVRHRRDVLELIGEDRLGVVEQPPDQRRLPVVHRAGRREPQRVDRLRNSRQPCGPPSRPRSGGRRRASRRAR